MRVNALTLKTPRHLLAAVLNRHVGTPSRAGPMTVLKLVLLFFWLNKPAQY